MIIPYVIDNQNYKHAEALNAIKYLNQQLSGTQIKELRKIYNEFQAKAEPPTFIGQITDMREKYGISADHMAVSERIDLKREDLKLICFDYVYG